MKIAGLTIAHFGVDLCCALLIAHLSSSAASLAMLLLLYNFCAFALQLPFGILADRLGRSHIFSALGMLLTAIALLLPAEPLFRAVMAGCGNALFHVGGGIEVLERAKGRAWVLGVFVAPGALGLFLGASFAIPLWLPAAILAIGSAPLLFAKAPCPSSALPSPRLTGTLLALFGVVVLRSYLGFCMSFSWNTTLLSAAGIAVGTMLGKAAGGFLLGRLRWLPFCLCTLLPAGILLLFPQIPVLGLLGLFFFQMTMPATLWAAARGCPGGKGFSFGLLTFALFLGFLPKLLGAPMPNSGLFLCGGALLSLLLLLPGRRCAQ